MNKSSVIIYVVFLFVSAEADAGIFTSDGNSFSECMENRRQDIKNNSQYAIADAYCREKHHIFDPAAVVFVEPEQAVLYSFSGTNSKASSARPFITSLEITNLSVEHDGKDYGHGLKSHDFKWYLEFDITNRNDFPIAGLIIGIPKNRFKQCSWDEENYSEFYNCGGSAQGKMTGIFKCYIPKIEQRKINSCITGFAIYTTPTDANSFLKTHNLSSFFK